MEDQDDQLDSKRFGCLTSPGNPSPVVCIPVGSHPKAQSSPISILTLIAPKYHTEDLLRILSGANLHNASVPPTAGSQHTITAITVNTL
jgi:hypothetical protein